MRTWVVGCTGAGKSTLAKRIAATTGVPHLELDAMFHQTGWTPLPRPEFRQRVSAFLDQSDWVVDGNYDGQVGDLTWAAADRVVWVDPSKPRVMAQVLSRTLRRALGRQELWNGNREAPLQLFRTDPEENIVLWAWTRFDKYRVRYAELAQAVDGPKVIRLCHRPEIDAYVDGLGGSGAR